MLVAAVRQKQSLFAEAREQYLALIPDAMRLADDVLAARLRSNLREQRSKFISHRKLAWSSRRRCASSKHTA